jgi:hypothetical protein
LSTIHLKKSKADYIGDSGAYRGKSFAISKNKAGADAPSNTAIKRWCGSHTRLNKPERNGKKIQKPHRRHVLKQRHGNGELVDNESE